MTCAAFYNNNVKLTPTVLEHMMGWTAAFMLQGDVLVLRLRLPDRRMAEGMFDAIMKKAEEEGDVV